MRDCGLDNVEHGRNVRRKGLLPLLVGYLLDRIEAHLVGSVDEDVDLSELADRGLDDLTAMVRVGNIAGDQYTLPSRLFDQALGLVGVVMLVKVRDQDVRPLPGESERYRSAIPESAPVIIVFLSLSLFDPW